MGRQQSHERNLPMAAVAGNNYFEYFVCLSAN